MAEQSSSLGSLREANLLLLSKLHVAQKGIWKDVKTIKYRSESSDYGKSLQSSKFTSNETARTPVTMRRRGLSELSAKSSAKQYEIAECVVSTPQDNRGKENMPVSGEEERLNSILRTPQSRRRKQLPDHRHHVTFNSPIPAANVTGNRDQSLLGYDWIAGMLDNNSYLSGKDDGFFEELKEFRRVNRSECSGTSFLQEPFKSPLLNQPPAKQEEKYHKCGDTYVLDERLFAVPIHGAESYCVLCKTKKPSEYETEGSYVRISVPRSTLQSPHRVKPHRRKSFDSTDTVSLSKHCLLGWESSRPAVIPSQSSLDLRAHTGISKLNALNWTNTSVKSNQDEYFNRDHLLKWELQRTDCRKDVPLTRLLS